MGYVVDKAKVLKSNLINIAVEKNGSTILSVETIFDMWKPDEYKVGDVRRYNGQLWRCCQQHNSLINEDIIPGRSPAHWVSYHATSVEYAKQFVHPTGAHDIYKSGEYMIYEDEKIYLCKQDTNFSPDEYMDAWEIVDLIEE